MTAPIDFTQNDFYECGPSAGAGWGDPIDREPERVAADVRDNAVSAAMAREVYGVVLGKDGGVDAKATTARRGAIRKERLAWKAEKTASNLPADTAKAETMALAGDGATVARVNGGLWFRCNCGHCIAPASENWKLYAKSHSTTAAELGPRISLHKELEVRRYACPSCARLHDVEVKLAADAPLFDTEIRF
jgi:N-methylhydantoinase B